MSETAHPGSPGPQREAIFPGHARAHWLTPGLVAWPRELPEGGRAALHFSARGDLAATQAGVTGGGVHRLQPEPRSVSDVFGEQYPHLAGYRLLRLPELERDEVRRLLRGQLAVSLTGPEGLIEATGVQTAGVIDQIFHYSGPLGADPSGSLPVFRLWAPTARSVALLLARRPDDGSEAQRHSMYQDPSSGVWSLLGNPAWDRRFYRYEVEVFVPSTGRVERNQVTDPYSLSLSADSRWSQVVDLSDPDLTPPGWRRDPRLEPAAARDIVLYELHVRDFSISDPSVPEPLRGTFAAFALDSHGSRHLRRLARAGVTHVHLLPVFDLATIPDRKEERREPAIDLASFPADSERQQAAVAETASIDGFNWGYDPYHYTVPEGSYSTEPDGTRRILEFRQMVQALERAGLRLVMDVVYNHTHAAGQDPRSVLDRIVPGYYHRRGPDGEVYTTTCCANTATEHRMMRKLMVDSVSTWARDYRVSGFRFDLMGHHFRADMLEVRRALDSLTPAADGVDGASVYLYGEGWDFGEVENNARGVNATQLNMAGTGIGTFNDRLRDGARGGTPFANYREQGFATGLHTDPNRDSPPDPRSKLLEISDWVRLGLAGNLARFPLVDHRGRQVTGSEVLYGGKPAAYTRAPRENIVYVEAHDNETLFDVVQVKAPRSAPMSERVRMQKLGISLVALAQGIPFFHAGMELLRSKSMDRNSYDSGDWFNKLDFTYQSNNWGVGLPPRRENEAHWPLMRELLGDPALRPTAEHIRECLDHFLEMLRIRRSSPLFRLPDAESVLRHLRFHNTGPGQLPGVIVMSLSDADGSVDPRFSHLLVVFNGRPGGVQLESPLGPAQLELHPIQRDSRDPRLSEVRFDAASRRLAVAGRTTAVFVGLRPL